MVLIRFFFVLFFISFSSIKSSSVVKLLGNAPSFKGFELVFNSYSDPFSSTEITIGRCKVDSSGNFSVTLPISDITYIFSHLGIYMGYMYLEPGKEYIISFPDKKEKAPSDKLNPFFEESEFQFSIKNRDNHDLNKLILSFNDLYDPVLKNVIKNIYSGNNKASLDSSLNALKTTNSGIDNSFYNKYVDYKIEYLKFLAYRNKSKSISNEFFQHKPVLYNNPAYLELFNQVYNKYFYFFGRTNFGKIIYDDINNRKSYFQLSQTLQSDSILKNDSLREMVVLKNIHDEFYSNNFSRSGLLCLLDSFIINTKIIKHKVIAGYIRSKITLLMPEFPPPEFELFDRNGKLVKSSDLLGKYVYLNFCICSSYSCIKEFDLLKNLNNKYKDRFLIVTIATDENREQMSNFITKSEYNWLFLHYGNQPDILKQYDIRAYPTYFLIGPDGKLIYSPAASPGENFELYLFKAMRLRGDI